MYAISLRAGAAMDRPRSPLRAVFAAALLTCRWGSCISHCGVTPVEYRCKRRAIGRSLPLPPSERFFAVYAIIEGTAPRPGEHSKPKRGRRKADCVARRGSSGHSYEEMCSASRRRSLTKAKAVATVLSVRSGASAATMARLFRRSRSRLSEQVEYYRQRQPRIYLEAMKAFALDGATPPAGDTATSNLGLGA